MASSGSQDPLDVLQLMVNEVLVQTGKALRASRKDGLGNVAQAHGSLQNKLPDTIRTFHSALDTLEHDIIRAKSVLLRDLTQLQQKRQPLPVPEPEPEAIPQKRQQQHVKQVKQVKQEKVHPQPSHPQPVQQQPVQQQPVQQQPVQQQPVHQQPFQQVRQQQVKQQPQHQALLPQQHQQLPPPQPRPIESQSKSPMVIDIDSSSPANDPSVTEIKPPKPAKQMAPFPDMGMGLPDMKQADIQIKKELTPSVPPGNSAPPEDIKTDAKASPAPMASMPPMAPMVEEKSLDDGMDFIGGDVNPPGSELTFTNMEFTLAPANDDSGNPVATQGQSFDLTAFAPADGGGGGDLLSLDILPPNPQGQPIANPPLQPQPQMQPQETVQQSIENKDENLDSTFDDLFLLDAGGDYGGGNMEATFDDLMNDRFDDNGFDSMEHGKFDDAFFGLNANMS